MGPGSGPAKAGLRSGATAGAGQPKRSSLAGGGGGSVSGGGEGGSATATVKWNEVAVAVVIGDGQSQVVHDRLRAGTELDQGSVLVCAPGGEYDFRGQWAVVAQSEVVGEGGVAAGGGWQRPGDAGGCSGFEASAGSYGRTIGELGCGVFDDRHAEFQIDLAPAWAGGGVDQLGAIAAGGCVGRDFEQAPLWIVIELQPGGQRRTIGLRQIVRIGLVMVFPHRGQEGGSGASRRFRRCR